MASMAMGTAAAAKAINTQFAAFGEFVAPAQDHIVDYMPLVRSVARRMHRGLPQHVELDDLISAGTVGLLDAVSRYQPGRDASFKGYAQVRIRGAILDSMRELDWGTRELRRRGRDIQKAISNCERQLGRAPEEEEIAAEMKLSVGALRESLGELHQLEVGSLNVECGPESDEQEISFVADPSEPGALFHCLRGELRQRLAEAIDELPERERLIITLSYYEELTLKEIGAVLGVVESRVSQLRSSAVLRLRTALANCR